MFVVGTHVPVRDTSLRSSMPEGARCAPSSSASWRRCSAWRSARSSAPGHAVLYAVLMASSSAALALPVIDSLGLDGPAGAVGDRADRDRRRRVDRAAAVGDRPEPRPARGTRRLGHRGVRGGAVPRAAAAATAGAGASDYTTIRSKHEFALELRFSLLILFVLCALAATTHVSIMLAGFALGLVIAAIGRAASAGTSTVRHHRGLLRAAVLRLARRVTAGSRTR